MIIYIAISIAMGLAGVGAYIFFMRKGQFNNLEDVKYQLFREDEDNK